MYKGWRHTEDLVTKQTTSISKLLAKYSIFFCFFYFLLNIYKSYLSYLIIGLFLERFCRPSLPPPPTKRHLAVSRGIFGCHDWGVLVASGGWRPETLLSVLPCTGRHPPQRLIQPQRSIVPILRRLALEIARGAITKLKTIRKNVTMLLT